MVQIKHYIHVLTFLTFNDSLFNFNQLLIFVNSSLSFMSAAKSCMFRMTISKVVESVVSSAYMTKSTILLVFALSFTYIMNRKGPSMEP